MRGRTNVPQRVRPTVNGDIITANVINSAISVGDFVEHNTVVADEPLFNRTNSYTPIYNQDVNSTYKFVLWNGGQADIWNKATSSLQHSITLSLTYDPRACVLSNGDIVVTTKTGTGASKSPNVTIYYLKIENDELVIKTTTTISTAYSSKDYYMVAVGEVDSTHICLFCLPPSSAAWLMVVLEVNATTGAITETTRSAVTSPTSTPTSNSVPKGKIYKISEKVVFIAQPLILSNAHNMVGFIVTFANNYTWNFTTYTSIGAADPYGGYLMFDKISDNYFAFVACGSSSASASNTYFYIVNVTTSSITVVTSATSAINMSKPEDMSVDSTFPIYFAFAFGSNKILFAFYNNTRGHNVDAYGSISFDPSNSSLAITSFLDMTGTNISYKEKALFLYYSSLNNICVVYNNGSSSSDMVLYQLHIGYNATDEELEGMTDISTVKPYAGGKAIGFAKTGGAVGESIQIYVPHQS